MEKQNYTWRTAGASVVGTSHLRGNLPCQDACLYAHLPGNAVLLLAADGAGSASHAEQGAQAAVDYARRSIEQQWSLASRPLDLHWEEVLQTAIAATRQGLVILAEQKEIELRELAATLTAVISAPNRLSTAQLGDGAAVFGTQQGELYLAFQPSRGEYANESIFLTQEDALEHLSVTTYHGDIRDIAVLTDGLLRLALQLPAYQPHVPFFAPLWDFLRGANDEDEANQRLAEFLASDRVNLRADDDKTLLLASLVEQPG